MAKTIKLEDQVHRELEEIRSKRETYSQAVARLIATYRSIQRIIWGSTGDQTQVPGPGG